jgi:hypothetical protein
MNKEYQNRGWIDSETLGHAKMFCWRMNKDGNIIILRKFNIKSYKIKHETEISREIIDGLIASIQNDEWFPLANNVEKLRNGTEVDGVGKYLYQHGFNETQAQSASHLSTIFYEAGIWLYNGKRKGMKFRKNPNIIIWVSHLRAYFNSHLQNSKM